MFIFVLVGCNIFVKVVFNWLDLSFYGLFLLDVLKVFDDGFEVEW